jgi:hypothetical protein
MNIVMPERDMWDSLTSFFVGELEQAFDVHLAKDFGIVTIGKFCDKIWVKLIGYREKF